MDDLMLTQFQISPILLYGLFALFPAILALRFEQKLLDTHNMVLADSSDAERLWQNLPGHLIIGFLILVCTAIAAILSGPIALAFWMLVAALSVFWAIWSLLGFMIWPWEKEFWDFYRKNKMIRFILGAIVLPAIALIAAIALGIFVLPLAVIAAIVLVWWVIFTFGCEIIKVLDKVVKELIKYIWKQMKRWFKNIVWEYKQFTKRIEYQVVTWRHRRVQRCEGYFFLIRWLCTALTWVLVLVRVILVMVAYAAYTVLVAVTVFIAVVAWALFAAVVYVVSFVVRTIFWCWGDPPPDTSKKIEDFFHVSKVDMLW